MKWLKRRTLCATAWLLIAIFCWCGMTSAKSTIEALWQPDPSAASGSERVSYRNVLSNASFESMDELRYRMSIDGGDGAKVTGWAQSLSQSVRTAGDDAGSSTGGSTTIDVIWVDGDASAVCNLRMVNGDMLFEGDDAGCVLDKATALKIFGSTNVIGQKVVIAGSDYTVRGIAELPSDITSMGADPGRGLAFCSAANTSVNMTALDFSIPRGGKKTPSELADNWISAAGVGLSGDKTVVSENRALLEIYSQIPGVILLLFVLIEVIASIVGLAKATTRSCLRAYRDRTLHQRTVLRIGLCGGAGVLALIGIFALALGVMKLTGHVPPSYIPTAWSNFEFWPELFTSRMRHAAQGALQGALRPDRYENQLINWSVFLGILSAGAMIMARRAFKQRTAEPVSVRDTLCLAAIAAMPPVSLSVFAWMGWTPGSVWGMTVLPVLMAAAIVLLRTYPPYILMLRFKHKVLIPMKGGMTLKKQPENTPAPSLIEEPVDESEGGVEYPAITQNVQTQATEHA